MGQQGRAKDTDALLGSLLEEHELFVAVDAVFQVGITVSHVHPPSSIRTSTVQGQFHVTLWSICEVGRKKI